MELVVETGAGIPNANSWVDLDFADLYHASLGNKAWANASGEDRTALLLKATLSVIVPRYAGRWKGEIAFESQSLPWPRRWYHDDEDRWVSAAFVPSEVQFLQCEVALNMLENPDFDKPKERGIVISSEKIGPITTTLQYDPKAPEALSSPKVSRLARPLLDGSTGQVRMVRS